MTRRVKPEMECDRCGIVVPMDQAQGWLGLQTLVHVHDAESAKLAQELPAVGGDFCSGSCARSYLEDAEENPPPAKAENLPDTIKAAIDEADGHPGQYV